MPNDVTAKLTILPSPFKSSPYSQSIWDMQLFNGKIYIGQGNSANSGPPTCNAGPIPIHSLDPLTNTFTSEYTVNEEQIDVFRIIDGKLTVPGHDSKEGWDLGNYYTLESTGWTKHRVLPNGIHVYDMVGFKGKMFASLGTDGTKPTIVFSEDKGLIWKPAIAVSSSESRMHTLFEFEDNLYAVTNLINYPKVSATTDSGSMLRKWDGKTFVPLSNLYGGGVMLPNTPAYPFRIARVTPCMGKLLYMAGIGINDHQVVGNYAYALATMKPQAVNITKPIPYIPAVMPTWDDLLVHPSDFLDRGTKAYMLSYQKNTNKTYTSMASVSTDCINWTELFRFTNDSLARSFEELNGTFYLGLGANPTYAPLPNPIPSPYTAKYEISKSPGCVVIVKP